MATSTKIAAKRSGKAQPAVRRTNGRDQRRQPEPEPANDETIVVEIRQRPAARAYRQRDQIIVQIQDQAQVEGPKKGKGKGKAAGRVGSSTQAARGQQPGEQGQAQVDQRDQAQNQRDQRREGDKRQLQGDQHDQVQVQGDRPQLQNAQPSPDVSNAATGLKGKKQTEESYNLPVHVVLKLIHPDLQISTEATSTMDDLLNDMFHRLSIEASKLAKVAGRKTMSEHDFEAAVQLVLPSELASHAHNEGAKALKKYKANLKEKEEQKDAKQAQAESSQHEE